jgi:nucleoside-diphosphate-sugar epimerase
MDIVITGGSGFIGTHLVRLLLDEGHAVRIYDKRPSEAFPDLVTLGDVRDEGAMTSALQGADVVYHLAAEHHDDVRPVSRYYEVNSGGAEKLVAACEANGVNRIIFTSTAAVYGLDEGEADESTPVTPFNDYGKSKLQAERVFLDWAKVDTGRSLFMVRPVVVFGEGNTANVYNLIMQIAGGRFIMVGSGENRKSMAYVGNLVPLLAQVLGRDSQGEIVNYADKPDLSVGETVKVIRDELGQSGTPLRRLPYWLGMLGGYGFDALARVRNRAYAISSIRIKKFCANTQVATRVFDDLDFKAPYSLEEGLRRMIASLPSEES